MMAAAARLRALRDCVRDSVRQCVCPCVRACVSARLRAIERAGAAMLPHSRCGPSR